MLIWMAPNSNNEYLISRSGCRDYLSRNAAAGISAIGLWLLLNVRLNRRLHNPHGRHPNLNAALWLQRTIVQYSNEPSDFDESWNNQLVDRYFSWRHSSACYMKRRSSISTDSQCFRLFVYSTFHFLRDSWFVVARRRSLSKANATQHKCRSHCFSSVIFNDQYIIHSLQKSQFIRFQVWKKSLSLQVPSHIFVYSHFRITVCPCDGWIPFHHRNLDLSYWLIHSNLNGYGLSSKHG
jgi:hypothetical protein